MVDAIVLWYRRQVLRCAQQQQQQPQVKTTTHSPAVAIIQHHHRPPPELRSYLLQVKEQFQSKLVINLLSLVYVYAQIPWSTAVHKVSVQFVNCINMIPKSGFDPVIKFTSSKFCGEIIDFIKNVTFISRSVAQ